LIPVETPRLEGQLERERASIYTKRKSERIEIVQRTSIYLKNIQLTNLSIYSLPSAAVAKTILRRSPEYSEGGFSWVLVDAEHGLINDSHYYEVYIPPLEYQYIPWITQLTATPSSQTPSATKTPVQSSVCPGPKNG
jgi:hypothetical protein